MERLDKIISNQTGLSRKDVKGLIHKGQVLVNKEVIEDASKKVDTKIDVITINNQELIVKKHIYLLLNKPKGYVSATTDNKDKTVLELVPSIYQHRNLFPAGRLDKDTTGMMIITDDGDFAHEILSPKKHISKKYLVEIDKPITDEMIKSFQQGVKLIDGVCSPSILEKIDDYHGYVTLTEGRYHQIKRMFGTHQAKVKELKRMKMGNLELPNSLLEGECRELTELELKQIKERE